MANTNQNDAAANAAEYDAYRAARRDQRMQAQDNAVRAARNYMYSRPVDMTTPDAEYYGTAR